MFIYIYIYINNTLPPALAVHEIYRDIFGPPMVSVVFQPKFQGRLTHRSNLSSAEISLLNTLFNKPECFYAKLRIRNVLKRQILVDSIVKE